MTQATHWFADKLIDYNQSQDTGMMIIKIPSWEYFELKGQAQELETQLNKSSFGKGQEWEHKNMITKDDTKVSETFLENTPTSSQTEISDDEITIGRFMNWFLKHYSTATIDGFFGYVNAMGQEVRIQDILNEYKKFNGIENN